MFGIEHFSGQSCYEGATLRLQSGRCAKGSPYALLSLLPPQSRCSGASLSNGRAIRLSSSFRSAETNDRIGAKTRRIIQANIERYKALLKTETDPSKRAMESRRRAEEEAKPKKLPALMKRKLIRLGDCRSIYASASEQYQWVSSIEDRPNPCCLCEREYQRVDPAAVYDAHLEGRCPAVQSKPATTFPARDERLPSLLINTSPAAAH